MENNRLVDTGTQPADSLESYQGSGTVAAVAEKLGRRWIGIEINPDYVKIAEQRLEPFKNQSRLEG
jgi:DNA modification methylase